MSPVVLIIFNRPKHTAVVLNAIRQARPGKLFVVADGPRKNNERDAFLCAQARCLLENIDWPCVVARNYSDENLGLRKRVVTGLDWVFRHEEEAIVLEDDCVPSEQFFGFCSVLLERYRDDPRVWAVSGDNFLGEESRGDDSYYFSKYFHCWGWATWRRVWRQFSPDIEFWSEFRSSPRWNELHDTLEEQECWDFIYSGVRSGSVNSWAFPFMLNMWRANGLCANPRFNLVENIGFDAEGTNCREGTKLSVAAIGALGAISDRNAITADASADRLTFINVYRPTKLCIESSERQHFPAGLWRDPRRIFRKFLRTVSKISAVRA